MSGGRRGRGVKGSKNRPSAARGAEQACERRCRRRAPRARARAGPRLRARARSGARRDGFRQVIRDVTPIPQGSAAQAAEVEAMVNGPAAACRRDGDELSSGTSAHRIPGRAQLRAPGQHGRTPRAPKMTSSEPLARREDPRASTGSVEQSAIPSRRTRCRDHLHKTCSPPSEPPATSCTGWFAAAQRRQSSVPPRRDKRKVVDIPTTGQDGRGLPAREVARSWACSRVDQLAWRTRRGSRGPRVVLRRMLGARRARTSDRGAGAAGGGDVQQVGRK